MLLFLKLMVEIDNCPSKMFIGPKGYTIPKTEISKKE